MAQKFEDIIHRVEVVRRTLGLNKSRFSARVGLKPQTYNNFVGSQGSKPNVELIYGIVRAFNVNPMWLLNGTGPTFRGNDGAAWPHFLPSTMTQAGDTSEQGGQPATLNTLTEFKIDLDRLFNASRRDSASWQSEGVSRDSQIRHATQVLLHHFIASPDETAIHVMNMLRELRRLADEVDAARKTAAAVEARRATGGE
jgi:DNA-binding XRE family transcriptional regulator